MFKSFIIFVNILSFTHSLDIPTWSEWTIDRSHAYVNLYTGDNVHDSFNIFCKHHFPDSNKDLCYQNLWSLWRHSFGYTSDVHTSPSNTIIMTLIDSCQQASIRINNIQYWIRVDATDDINEVGKLALSVGCAIDSDDTFRKDLVSQVQTNLHGYVESARRFDPSQQYSMCIPAIYRRRARQHWRDVDIQYTDTTKSLQSSSYRCVYPYRSSQAVHPDVLAMHPMGSCIYQNLVYYKNEWIYVYDADETRGKHPTPPAVRLDTMRPSHVRNIKDGVFSPRVEERNILLQRVRADREKLVAKGEECADLLWNYNNSQVESLQNNILHINRLHILIKRLVPANHGHALLDAALPLLLSLDLHHSLGHIPHNFSIEGEAVFDNQILILGDDAPTVLDDRLKLVSKWGPLYVATDRNGIEQGLTTPPSDFEIWQSMLCPTGVLCQFGSLMAGVGGFGYIYLSEQHSLRKEFYHKLRRVARRRLFDEKQTCSLNTEHECTHSEGANSAPKALYDINDECVLPHCTYTLVHGNESWLENEDFKLLIIQRANVRSLSNINTIVNGILSRYPAMTVVIDNFENKSLEYQFTAMQSVSAMIAIDGAAVDNAIFLSPCSGLVIIGRSIEEWGAKCLEDGFDMHKTPFNTWQQWLAISLLHTPKGTTYVRSVDDLVTKVEEMLHLRHACLLSRGTRPPAWYGDKYIEGDELNKSSTTIISTIDQQPVVVLETNGSIRVKSDSVDHYRISNLYIQPLSPTVVLLDVVLRGLRAARKSVTVFNPESTGFGYAVFRMSFSEAHVINMYSETFQSLEYLSTCLNYIKSRTLLPTNIFFDSIDYHRVSEKNIAVSDITLCFGTGVLNYEKCFFSCMSGIDEEDIRACLYKSLSERIQMVARATRQTAVLEISLPQCFSAYKFSTILEEQLSDHFETFRILGYTSTHNIFYEAYYPLWRSRSGFEFGQGSSQIYTPSNVRVDIIHPSYDAIVTVGKNATFEITAVVHGLDTTMYDEAEGKYVRTEDAVDVYIFVNDHIVYPLNGLTWIYPEVYGESFTVRAIVRANLGIHHCNISLKLMHFVHTEKKCHQYQLLGAASVDAQVNYIS